MPGGASGLKAAAFWPHVQPQGAGVNRLQKFGLALYADLGKDFFELRLGCVVANAQHLGRILHALAQSQLLREPRLGWAQAKERNQPAFRQGAAARAGSQHHGAAFACGLPKAAHPQGQAGGRIGLGWHLAWRGFGQGRCLAARPQAQAGMVLLAAQNPGDGAAQRIRRVRRQMPRLQAQARARLRQRHHGAVHADSPAMAIHDSHAQRQAVHHALEQIALHLRVMQLLLNALAAHKVRRQAGPQILLRVAVGQRQRSGQIARARHVQRRV